MTKSIFKRVLTVLLTAAIFSSLLVMPGSSASTLLPQAVKSHTGKTPTAAQQSQLNQIFPGVVCFGDSLTQGISYAAQGQHVKSYVRYLGELISDNLVTGYNTINRSVNFGINGDRVAGITARSGAMAVQTTSTMNLGAAAGSSAPITLRITSTKDTIDWVALTNPSETCYGGISGKTAPNLTIDGVEGSIGYVGGKLSFIRKTAGTAKSWSPGQNVTYELTNTYSNYYPVIFMGYNNGPEWCYNNYAKYKSYLDAIINKYNTGRSQKRFVIIVPHFTDRCYLPDARTWLDKYDPNTINIVKTLESNLVRDYGNDHVIKAREFMNQHGLQEANLSATAEDNKRINAGAVPASLLNAYEAVVNREGNKTCYTHFNDAGNELLARAIYQKFYDQGAFNEVIDVLGLSIPKSSGGSTPTHTHSAVYVAAKSATCTTNGSYAYYSCSGCGKIFTDNACKNETTRQAVTIAAAGHKPSSTFSHDETSHYQLCSVCQVHLNTGAHTFSDYECTVCGYRTAPPHTHSIYRVEAKPAACTEAGNYAHYRCTGCDKVFIDPLGNAAVDISMVKIPATGHKPGAGWNSDSNVHYRICTQCGSHVDTGAHVMTNGSCSTCGYRAHTHAIVSVTAKPATCLASGNYAYYTCTECHQCFLDAQGKMEVDSSIVTIAKKNHTPDNTAWQSDSNGHYHVCTTCQTHLDEAAHTYSGNVCTVCFYRHDGVDTGDETVCDFDGNGYVESDDAVYLLSHIIRADLFPIREGINLDFNKDGSVSSDDAVYLLSHIIRPDLFPID